MSRAFIVHEGLHHYMKITLLSMFVPSEVCSSVCCRRIDDRAIRVGQAIYCFVALLIYPNVAYLTG
jgi:hypothetical protein